MKKTFDADEIVDILAVASAKLITDSENHNVSPVQTMAYTMLMSKAIINEVTKREKGEK